MGRCGEGCVGRGREDMACIGERECCGEEGCVLVWEERPGVEPAH